MSVLKKGIVLAGLGLSVLASGCQTWVPEAGVTLPSGEWLLHPPQFFAPSPQFPLPREMKAMQEAHQTPYLPVANPGGQ
jgi:hypothetical protein